MCIITGCIGSTSFNSNLCNKLQNCLASPPPVALRPEVVVDILTNEAVALGSYLIRNKHIHISMHLEGII
jgi:hypothetical protein